MYIQTPYYCFLLGTIGSQFFAKTITNTSHNDHYYKTKHFNNPVHGHVVASLYEHIYTRMYLHLQYKILTAGSIISMYLQRI